jgi:hypothetical protein
MSNRVCSITFVILITASVLSAGPVSAQGGEPYNPVIVTGVEE